MPGDIGLLFIAIAIITALATVLLLRRSRRRDDESGMMEYVAKTAYLMHLFAVLVMALVLYQILYRNYTEYIYVMEHSVADRSFWNLISAFFSGISGILLAWIILQAFAGSMVVFSKGENRYTLITLFAIFQVILLLTISGIVPGGVGLFEGIFSLAPGF